MSDRPEKPVPVRYLRAPWRARLLHWIRCGSTKHNANPHTGAIQCLFCRFQAAVPVAIREPKAS